MIRVAAAALLVYAAILVLAYVRHGPATAFVAGRDLPANHRIVTGDVRAASLLSSKRTLHPSLRWTLPQSFVGRYARAHVCCGEPITPSDAADRPRLSPPPRRALFWVPLGEAAAAVASTLEAGDTVDVCGDTAATCVSGVPVAAVACTSEAAPACSAGLWLPDTGKPADALLQALKAHPVHVIVHKNGAPP